MAGLIWRFTVEVIEEWKGWLSGSLPMVVLATAAWLYPQMAPLPIWEWAVLVFVAGFVCAVFRVYRRLQMQLDALALKRPFMYENFKLVAAGPFGSLNNSQYHCSVTLCFENRGDELIRFKMKDAFVEINGHRSPALANERRGRIVHPGEKFSFVLQRVDSVPIPGFPFYIDIFFDAEYDNVPPVKSRSSMRKIKYQCYDFQNTQTWTNFVLDESEA